MSDNPESNNHGNDVKLVGYYGGDEAHALSAWTSTGSAFLYEIEKTGHPRRARIPALLDSLAANGHHTPFEKSSLHFLVTAETASHIHLIKHRIGVSINAESARYKELNEDKYYIPRDWPIDEQQLLDAHCEACFRRYHDCLDRLIEKGISRKRAKESARFYLPYAAQLNFDVMFNFRSFMHFIDLRLSNHAQVEIRSIARSMLDQIHLIPGNPFGASISAFIKAGEILKNEC